MSEMVDNMKRSIGSVLNRNSRGQCLLIPSDEELEEIARAAIAGMLHYTFDMEQEGMAAMNRGDPFEFVWRNAINAALRK